MATKLISIEIFILNRQTSVFFHVNFVPIQGLYAHRDEGWQLSIPQMMDIVKSYDGKAVTEVHIVGGVHPKMDLNYFCDLFHK